MRFGLQAKFLVPTIALLVLALGIAAAISYTEARRAMDKAAIEQLNMLANATMREFDSWIEQARLNLRNWGGQRMYVDAIPDTYIGKSARKAANHYLALLKDDYQLFETLGLADSEGRVVASSDPDLFLDTAIADQPYFQNALEDQVVVTNIVQSNTSGRPVFRVAVPVHDLDDTVGVLFAVISLDYFARASIDTLTIGEAGYAYIMNTDGTILAHPDDEQVFNLNIGQEPFGRAMLEQGEGLVTYHWEGSEKKAAYRTHPQLGAVIAISAETSDLFAPARRIRTIILTFAAILIIATSIIIYLIARSIVSPINQIIDEMTYAIAKGDFSKDLSIKRKDEIGKLADAFQHTKNTIRSVLQETDTLIQSIQEGKLHVRGNAEAFSGEWRELLQGVNAVIDAFAAPINMTAEAIDRIAKGDIPGHIQADYRGEFNKIIHNLNMLIDAMETATRTAEEIANGNLAVDVKERSSEDRLMQALNLMIRRLNSILQEINDLTGMIQRGRLEARGTPDAYDGGWRELMTGINNVIEAFVAPINVTAEYLDRIAEGDIPAKITEEYLGDFNEIKSNLNMLIDTMDGLLQETDTLIQGIQHGQLQTRGNTQNFNGSWRELVEGINDVIAAFVAPINVTAEYLERIAQGNIPDAITEEYQGDFNEIKSNLNVLIETMTSLLGETAGLIQAVQDGTLESRGNADGFSGSWQDLVLGINGVIDAFVAPITLAATAIDQIAQGERLDPIAETYQGDFNTIIQNLNTLIGAMNDITHMAEEMAAGNLEIEMSERSENDTLMQALNSMCAKLQEIVLHVKTAADMLAESSRDVNVTAGKMAEGATQQAAAAEEASSSMQQMAANIRQNADNALHTEKIAKQAVEYAQESGRVVAETVFAMQQITKKILIIQEIAKQTHLLSLNATIEAARAQEHGKAFSVVASEVRKLSDNTKGAAEEIDELASSSLDVSENAGNMLSTLVPDIQKTAELVQEISAASNEQSTGANQINRAIQQLDQVTQQNAITAEQMTSTSEGLANQAKQLQRTIAFFRVQNWHQNQPPQEDRPEPADHRPARITEKAVADNADDSHRPWPFHDKQDDEFERY